MIYYIAIDGLDEYKSSGNGLRLKYKLHSLY